MTAVSVPASDTSLREVLAPYAVPRLGRADLEPPHLGRPVPRADRGGCVALRFSPWLAAHSRSSPPASWCARSSSSTTARTARSCRRGARTRWLGAALGRARLLAVRELAPRARRPSRDRRRPRPPRRRRRPDADRRRVPRAAPWRGRLGYRLFRNPLVMFGLGPLCVAHARAAARLARSAPRRIGAACSAPTSRSRVLVGALCWLARLAGRSCSCSCPTLLVTRRRRHLALLRPAPVRGRLLGGARDVELRRRRAAGQLVPEAAASPAVLHRQHRPAPRPPPERADPELQPAGAHDENPVSTACRRSRSATACARRG